MNTPNHLTDAELHALVDDGLWPTSRAEQLRIKHEDEQCAERTVRNAELNAQRMLLLDECLHGHSNCGLDGKCGEESQ